LHLESLEDRLLLSGNAPDLEVINFGFQSAFNLQAGEPVTLTWSDLNVGSAPAAGGWLDHLVVVNTYTGQTLVDTLLNQNTGDLPSGSDTPRFYTFTLANGPLGAGALQATVTTDAANTVAEDNDSGTAEANNSAQAVGYVSGPYYPDLQVSNLQWQWNGTPGVAGPITVTWSDFNSGQAAATSWNDRIQVVNQLTGKTLVDAIVPGNFQNLYPGGFSSQLYNFTLPAGFDGVGPLQLTVTTDFGNNLYEYNFYTNFSGYGELNNDATLTTFSSPADSGDLSIANLSFAPTSNVQSGGLITLQWNDVQNGMPITTSYLDRIVVINQSTGQTLVDTVQNFPGGLGNTYSAQRFLNFQLPDGYLGTGQLLVTVTVDSLNSVSEFNYAGSQEFNNVASITGYSYLANYADLTVTGINFLIPPVAGSQALLQWNDVNNGASVNGAAWSDRIVITNAISGEVLLDTTKSYSATPLYGGASLNRFLSFTLPNSQASNGPLNITITTDSGNTLYEFNYNGTAESNNSATYSAYSNYSPADLQIQNVFFDAPTGYVPGALVTVHWSDVNSGIGSASGGWYDSLNVSTPNASLITGSVYTGSTLTASGVKQQSYAFLLPNNYVPGTPLQFAISADVYNSIAENNSSFTGELNNNYATAINRSLFTDLSAGVAFGPPYTPGSDLLLQWADNVTGVPPAAGWIDRITIVNSFTGQVLLDTTQPANTQYPGQYYIWSVPNNGTALGNLTVIIQVDADNRIAEYGDYNFGQINGEGNNTISMNIYGTAQQLPDLTIAQPGLTPGNVLQSGSAVTLQWQDYNAGAGATFGSWNDHVTIVNKFTGQTILDQVLPFNGSITPGSGIPRSLTFTLPDGVAGAGDMEIRITVDADNSLVEGPPNTFTESNNTADFTVTSQFANSPDLAVVNLGIVGDSILHTGQDVTINWLDYNYGNGAVANGKFVDRVTVTNLVTGETIVDTQIDANSIAIQPGNALQRYFHFRLPDGILNANQIRITVTTDDANNVYEMPGPGGGELNNAESITTYAQFSPSPDLQVTDLVVANTSPLYSGGPLTITWNDRNLGNGAATAGWQDRLQVVNMFTGQMLVDTNLYNPGGLAAGAAAPNSYSFTLPSGMLGAGYVRVIVTTDVGQNVGEYYDFSSEFNNTTVLTPDPFVNVGEPDLAILTAGYNLGSVWQPGGTVTVYWFDYNAGGYPLSGSWTDEVLVTNVATGQVLGSYLLSNSATLVSGNQVFNSVTFTLPNDASALGNLRVQIIADVNNEIPELSLYGGGEFNNVWSFDHLSAIAGDANGDGIVNGQDMALVASNWLTNGPPGDVNFDNIVNGQDMALIASNWLHEFDPGPSAGAAAILATSTTDQSATPSSDALALNVGHAAEAVTPPVKLPQAITSVTEIAPPYARGSSITSPIISQTAVNSVDAPAEASAAVAPSKLTIGELASSVARASTTAAEQASVALSSGQPSRSTLVNLAFAADSDDTPVERPAATRLRSLAVRGETALARRLLSAVQGTDIADAAAAIDSDLLELLAVSQRKIGH